MDHPEFAGPGWKPPSRLGNRNPLREEAPAILHRGWAKGASKPYALSEWSFVAPGRFRGMAGPLVAALCARDGWDGLWRFAYSHSAGTLPEGGDAGGDNYFDLACDPLAAASDRIGALLFLRTPRGGTEDGAVLEIDREAGSFRFVSPFACGGFSESGSVDAEALRFAVRAPAAVFAASLDSSPHASSSRILLAHLADVQGDGVRYAGETRTTLLAWGGAALVAAADADVGLRLSDPAACRVFRLDGGGRRMDEVPAEIRDGVLCFRLPARGPRGGGFFCEIARDR